MLDTARYYDDLRESQLEYWDIVYGDPVDDPLIEDEWRYYPHSAPAGDVDPRAHEIMDEIRREGGWL